MDRLPNEVLQLILNEQSKPSSFVKLNKRLRAFASDAYVRARYFLARHGKSQAMFYALGRGDVVTERVIEVLLSCGAYISRHLIQLAVQHFHHGYVSFISRPWVRNLPFIVFARFLSLACARFEGEIKLPSKKDPDDGTKFQLWIVERNKKIGSDEEKNARAVVEDLIGRWKARFQPVCDKDPAVAHFALTLAAEPKLLALAVANGYTVDPVHRDYIFRRLFIQPDDGKRNNTERKDELLFTLRDVCKSRDSSIFLSRTVAAEICLEAKSNGVAYDALKSLDREGLLRFDLITLIQDLIKSFVTSRSIVDPEIIAAIHYLFNDLPAHAANDAGVRHAVLLSVFATSLTANIANTKLLKLGLRPDPADAVLGVRQVYRIYHTTETLWPISRSELVPVLLSPYVHCHHAIATYARFYAFYPNETVEDMLEEVALACLKLPGKGQMLEMLTIRYTGLVDILGRAIKEQALDLDALPARDASEETKKRFRVALACEDGASVNAAAKSMIDSYLGDLTHETLTASFARDHVEDRQSWFRWSSRRAARGPQLERKKTSDATGLQDMDTEADSGWSTEPTTRWVVNTFGSMSVQAAVFADHVVTNWFDERQPAYWHSGAEKSKKNEGTLESVPMTMKHWEILARLGRQPSARMIQRVATGETFYESTDDYLMLESAEPVPSSEPEVVVMDSVVDVSTPARPRRAAAEKIKPYVEVGSDNDGYSSEIPLKAESGEVIRPKLELESLDDNDDGFFTCGCHRGCHEAYPCGCRCLVDSDDEFDARNENTPPSDCTLGLDCPERRMFFAPMAQRRAAGEQAKQLRLTAERVRRTTARETRGMRHREDEEQDMKTLPMSLSKVDKLAANARNALFRATARYYNKVQVLDVSPTQFDRYELDVLREEMEVINADVMQCDIIREYLQEVLDELRAGTDKQEKHLSLWISALGALSRDESKKQAETKKRLGLKRISKSSFSRVLEWRLEHWRDMLWAIHEDHRKRGED